MLGVFVCKLANDSIRRGATTGSRDSDVRPGDTSLAQSQFETEATGS